MELQNAICTLNYMPTEDAFLIAALERRGKTPTDGLRSHDISSASFEMRCRNVAARGRTRDYLRVLFTQITVRDEEGVVRDPLQFLFVPILAWFMKGLEGYYEASFKISPRASDVFVPDEFLFRRQLRWVAARWDGLSDAVDDLDHTRIKYLVAS